MLNRPIDYNANKLGDEIQKSVGSDYAYCCTLQVFKISGHFVECIAHQTCFLKSR